MNKNQLFRATDYLVYHAKDNGYIIWHKLFGNPMMISGETKEFLELFTAGANLAKIIRKYSLSRQEEMINSLVANYYLVPVAFEDRTMLDAVNFERQKKIIAGKMVKNLSLIMSEACNFRCSYCIHHNNLLASKRLKPQQSYMSFATAKKAVDIYMALMLSKGDSEAYINFGGGEPLLNWPTINEVLVYCRKKYDSKINITFSLNTNSSLLIPDIARSLKRYSVKVATSLDGLPESNDAVRKTKNGGSTFKMVWAGIRALKQVGHAVDGFSTTITDKNFPLLDERLVDFVADNQMKELRLDIDVIGMVRIPISEIVSRLMQLYEYAQTKGISVTGFWARPSENLSCSLAEDVSFCGAKRGNNFCVNPQGNIYPCGYSNIQLGNLSEIHSLFSPESAYSQYAISHLPGKNEFCRGCIVEGQCLGGCAITWEYAVKHQTAKIGRMCDFYRLMTQHLL